jgi:hypothetical protein
VCGNVPWRRRDGQAERLATGHEDVLWAVVVERFAGESAGETFQPQAAPWSPNWGVLGFSRA